MKTARDVRPITYMKTNAAELVESVADTGRAVVITQSGRARAVVMGAEAYDGWQDALALLKLAAQGETEIARGAASPQRAMFARLRSKLKRGG